MYAPVSPIVNSGEWACGSQGALILFPDHVSSGRAIRALALASTGPGIEFHASCQKNLDRRVASGLIEHSAPLSEPGNGLGTDILGPVLEHARFC